MIRRKFLSASSITGGFLFSGCFDSSNGDDSDSSSSNTSQDRPKGGLAIFNDTNANQTIEVLLGDEAGNTVLSEQYELEPDPEPRLRSFVAEVGRTYRVKVTTDDYGEEFEWKVDPEGIVLSIRIEDSGIRFDPLPPEG